MTKRNHSGFTIVEILIVIVVLGILAAITVVAYNGVSQQARNAARINTTKQLVDVLMLARVKTQPSAIRATFQNTNGWYRACIGTGYPDVNNDGVGDCGAYNNTPYVSESAAFNAILNKIGTLPSMATYPKIGATDNDVMYGPFASSAWVDGQDMISIEYNLEGEGQKCGLKPLIYYSSGGDTLTPTGNPDYSVSANGVTECMLAVIPDYHAQ